MRQKSSLLTSNELLLMLSNQPNQKIVNTMTYKAYTHRHAHIYIPLFRTTVKVNACFSIKI